MGRVDPARGAPLPPLFLTQNTNNARIAKANAAAMPNKVGSAVSSPALLETADIEGTA
jgi:hypothetical protein